MNTISFKVPYTIIGPGAAGNIGDIARDLGATKALIITDAGVVHAGLLEKIKSSLDKLGCKYDLYDAVKTNAPISVIEECIKKLTAGGYDPVIAIR